MRDIATTEVVLRSTLGIADNIIPIIEVVSVDDFNVINAEFSLRLLADSLVAGDIVIVVCDPRIHNRPHDSLAVQLDNGIIVLGPNNGVMSWIIKDLGMQKVLELPLNAETIKHPTFNGKYKFAVAANALLKGSNFDALGANFDADKLYSDNLPEGMILHVDNYGNLKINHPRLELEKGQIVSVSANGQQYDVSFGSEFWDVDEGEMIVYSGSSLWGLPEIAVSRGSAAKKLNLKVGDIIDIKF